MRTTRFSWHLRGGVCQGGLPGGVYLGGVCLWGGLFAYGVSAYGGCFPRGCAPPCEQNDWQTGVKTLPCPKLRLRAAMTLTVNLHGNNKFQVTTSTKISCLKWNPAHARNIDEFDTWRDWTLIGGNSQRLDKSCLIINRVLISNYNVSQH